MSDDSTLTAIPIHGLGETDVIHQGGTIVFRFILETSIGDLEQVGFSIPYDSFVLLFGRLLGAGSAADSLRAVSQQPAEFYFDRLLNTVREDHRKLTEAGALSEAKAPEQVKIH